MWLWCIICELGRSTTWCSLSKIRDRIELSIKSSKESTEPVSLLKTGNKVVEVG
jgi:hypothetical protein